MAKRRRRHRRGFRGLRGLGRIKMDGGGALIPVAAASILTAGTTLGLRTFLTPTPGTMAEKLYRWAPAIGSLAGLLGAGALFMLGGPAAGVTGAVTALGYGGFTLMSERLNANKPGAMLAISGGGSLPAEGTSGMGALLPEYAPDRSGLGTIVMEPLRGSYGEDVNVAGLGAGYKQDAFGRKPF